MTPNNLKFVQHVKEQCAFYGVKCSLRPVKYVSLYGNKCSGWFDETVPELVVSMKRTDCIEILVHEYSHLTQWVEGIELWGRAEVSLTKLWGWLDGKNHRNMAEHIGVCRDLELDNEKRSVKNIKKFNLDIDPQQYIKRANAYVQFYNYLVISRKWSNPDNSPYKNQRLLEAMSPKFNMKYDTLTPKLEKIFREENI